MENPINLLSPPSSPDSAPSTGVVSPVESLVSTPSDKSDSLPSTATHTPECTFDDPPQTCYDQCDEQTLAMLRSKDDAQLPANAGVVGY